MKCCLKRKRREQKRGEARYRCKVFVVVRFDILKLFRVEHIEKVVEAVINEGRGKAFAFPLVQLELLFQLFDRLEQK